MDVPLIASTSDPAQEKYTYDGQDVILDDISTLGGPSSTPETIHVKYQNAPGIDNKLAITNQGRWNYFIQDHLGSTVGVTDGTGNVVATNSYDSFGNPSNSSFSTRYQFTGREFDSFSGLQYSRARFYDPQIGRFISEDPIGFAGGDVNLYGYVRNNPLMFNDPFGLQDVQPLPYPNATPSMTLRPGGLRCAARMDSENSPWISGEGSGLLHGGMLGR